MKPVVYFTREITPEKVLELYKKVGKDTKNLEQKSNNYICENCVNQ